jgi:type II restriction enzyme
LISYQWPSWQISNLTLIPYFAFPESAVVPRKPLSAMARRAGWTGCNIDLRRITGEAKIPVVSNGTALEPSKVRSEYSRLKPLVEIKSSERGWTLDVLNLVGRFGDREFQNEDIYKFERELQLLHPSNRNVRAKVRQQLQVLRDLGLLIHLKPGSWVRSEKGA